MTERLDKAAASSEAEPLDPETGSSCFPGRRSLRTTSQSATQTAPLVGEPLAKRKSPSRDGEGKAAGWNHDLMFIDHFFKILIDE